MSDDQTNFSETARILAAGPSEEGAITLDGRLQGPPASVSSAF